MKNSTDSKISLTWTEPDEGGRATSVKNYIITWKSYTRQMSNVTNNNQTKFDIENLESNTLYNITITAVGGDNRNGTESDMKSGVTGLFSTRQ